MINISIPAIWIAFFGALFGAMLGVALSFWIIKREVQREVRRIENEYKFLLVQGLAVSYTHLTLPTTSRV